MSQSIKQVTLSYDLDRLPTVQHRAGLGGLLFLLESLQAAARLTSASFAVSGNRLELVLDRETLSVLLGYLYSEATVTRTMSSKPSGLDSEQVEVTLRDGQVVTKYAYQDRRPAGPWLVDCGVLPEWLGLWQDAIWSTLRDKSASRVIYTDSAAKLCTDLWRALVAVERGQCRRLGLSSALYIGARSKSSEGVPFDGTPAHVLLLHFAHTLAQTFKVVGRDHLGNRTYPGLVLVLPEPKSLAAYGAAMREYLRRRCGTSGGNFYSSTRVSALEEAGLTVLSGALAFPKNVAIGGVYCAQLVEQGHNVNLLAVAHITANQELIQRYQEVVVPITDFAVKKLVLDNLLKGAPLYRGAATLISSLPIPTSTAQGQEGQSFSVSAQQLLGRGNS